jgi:hypothetical protein
MLWWFLLIQKNTRRIFAFLAVVLSLNKISNFLAIQIHDTIGDKNLFNTGHESKKVSVQLHYLFCDY